MAKKRTFTEELRRRLQSVVDAGTSMYAIAKAAGVDQSVIGRFLSNPAKRMDSLTIDRLVEYLGLELAPKAKR